MRLKEETRESKVPSIINHRKPHLKWGGAILELKNIRIVIHQGVQFSESLSRIIILSKKAKKG